MLGFRTRLPIADELRAWADDGFERLAGMLGREAMLRCKVVLPDDSFFPDSFDGSLDSARIMAERIAGYMGVARDAFVVEMFAEGEESWTAWLPTGREQSNDAAGLYFQTPENGRHVIGVHANKLKDPEGLIATLAHELAHVLLLGGEKLDANAVDMEPMTDLATVFLGLGVFPANCCFRFKQWNDDVMKGWNAQKQGYLPEPLWGYALARFAQLRGEDNPAWRKALVGDVRLYFDKSVKWLRENPPR